MDFFNLEFLNYTGGETDDVMVKHYIEQKSVLGFIVVHPGHFSVSKPANEDVLYIQAINHDIKFKVTDYPGYHILINRKDFVYQITIESFIEELFVNTKDDVMILFYNTFKDIMFLNL